MGRRGRRVPVPGRPFMRCLLVRRDQLESGQPMPISPGTRFGQYEVVDSLGAGGMGEVYRARDTKLGRSVAIKILPDALAADADRIARFQREAKVLASLTHAGIAALYGMEEHDQKHVLVMELVEGETLAERLARGPLSVPAALGIAGQIAEA